MKTGWLTEEEGERTREKAMLHECPVCGAAPKVSCRSIVDGTTPLPVPHGRRLAPAIKDALRKRDREV